MTTSVNGITAYVTSTAGTVTEFLRQSALIAEEDAFVANADANKGGATLEDHLKTLTYTATGQNAWTHFSTLVEVYDSGTALAEIGSGDVAIAAGATPTDAEFNAAVARVNALSDYVNATEATI